MIPEPAIILADVLKALNEDVGSGDVTAALLPNTIVQAEIKSREPMLLCGQPWVNMLFFEVDSRIKMDWLLKEGEWVANPATLCRITGPARSILTGERTALNFLQTISATATQTHYYLKELKGRHTRLLDTRKTIPGLRHAQKYAVACAGGTNHRHGLFDAFLIKENHIKACGSIKKAIQLARATHRDLLVEVEVENLEELQEALSAEPDRIMLDNFSIAMLEKAVLMRKGHQCELEASGGVDLSTLSFIADTGVDFISVGAITKSIHAIDLSLLIVQSTSK